MSVAWFQQPWEPLRVYRDGPVAEVTWNQIYAGIRINSVAKTDHYAANLIDCDQSLLTLKTQGFPDGEKSLLKKPKAEFKRD